MSFIIDQGERKLIVRSLVDEQNNPIPWDLIEDIHLTVMIGGREYYDFSKSNGLVKKNGNKVQFELTQEQTQEFPPTQYQLRASLDVYDDRFTGLVTDRQWENPFMEIRILSNDSEFSSSVDEDTIKFSVIPSSSPVTNETPPSSSPVVSDIVKEADAATITFGGVSRATGYKYQLNGGAWIDIGNSTSFYADNLGLYSDNQVRLLAYNDYGDGDPSGVYTFKTLPVAPDEAPVVTIDSFTNTSITFSYTEVPRADDYVFYVNSQPIQVASGLTVTLLNLQEGLDHRINVAGRNPDATGPFGFAEQTTATRPKGVPSNFQFDEHSYYVDVSFDIVANSTGYIYRTGLDNTVDLANDPSFEIINGRVHFRISNLTVATNFNLEVRAYNEWGNGDWTNTIPFSTTAEEPVVSNTTITYSETTYNSGILSFSKATDGSTAQANLIYHLYTGNEQELSSKSSIEQLTPIQTATDANQFLLSALSEDANYFNIAVENEAGVMSIYNPVFVFIVYPKVDRVLFDTNDFQLDEGGLEEAQLEWTIDGDPDAEYTTSFVSNNTSVVTVDSNGLTTYVGQGVAEVMIEVVDTINNTTYSDIITITCVSHEFYSEYSNQSEFNT